MVGGREMWWVLASGGQLDGVVNSMGDYVNYQKNTTHSENSIFGIQSYFRAQTVALDAN
jgi:hypothetical protein